MSLTFAFRFAIFFEDQKTSTSIFELFIKSKTFALRLSAFLKYRKTSTFDIRLFKKYVNFRPSTFDNIISKWTTLIYTLEALTLFLLPIKLFNIS